VFPEEFDQTKLDDVLGLPGLHRIRILRGLTQEELATISGIPQYQISRYENGKKNCKIQNLILLARVLKCSLKDLLACE